MRGKLPLLILMTILAAVVAAGCGGDDSGGTDGTAASGGAAADGDGSGASEGSGGADSASGETLQTSSLGKEEYVERASAACDRRRNRIIPEMAAYLGGSEGVKEFTADQFGPVFREVVLPALEDELETIRALGAPEGDEEEIEAIVAGQEAAIEEVRKLENPESFAAVAKHFIGPSKTMEEYGFTACMNR